MNKQELLNNLSVLYNHPIDEEYQQRLYSHLVDKGWWSDSKITCNSERKTFLYKAFLEYYDLIGNGELRETEKKSNPMEHRYLLINLCRIQLEVEMNRVDKGDYEREL